MSEFSTHRHALHLYRTLQTKSNISLQVSKDIESPLCQNKNIAQIICIANVDVHTQIQADMRHANTTCMKLTGANPVCENAQ